MCREKLQKHLDTNTQYTVIYETQKLKKGKCIKLFNFLQLQPKYLDVENVLVCIIEYVVQ